MKVIYDCTVLSKWEGHYTGIQRTTEEIGRELKKLLPAAVLCIFDELGNCFAYDLETRQAERAVFIDKEDLIFSAGHDWDYPDHFKILQSYVARGAHFGVLFYDIIPIKLSFTYDRDFVARFRSWLNRALEVVDTAFTISERSKQDIMAYVREHGTKLVDINLVRLGDVVPSRGRPSDAIAKKARVPHILSVGTIEYRKNHLVLLNAYRYMAEDLGYVPPKLYIAGKQGYLDGGVRQQVEGDPRLHGLVEVLNGLTDDDLHTLYQSALFTVYPSVYEGWGLPVTESLYHGKPCITSLGTSMAEIAPGLTRLAHPLMVHDWVRHVQELNDPSIRQEESEYIRNTYQPVSWSDTARAICDALVKKYPNLKPGFKFSK